MRAAHTMGTDGGFRVTDPDRVSSLIRVADRRDGVYRPVSRTLRRVPGLPCSGPAAAGGTYEHLARHRNPRYLPVGDLSCRTTYYLDI